VRRKPARKPAAAAPDERLTVADLDSFLGLGSETNEALNGYLDAAAVNDVFDPFRLHPIGVVRLDSDVLIGQLLPRCEPITDGRRRGLWTLHLPDRRIALARLGSREAIRRTLDANPQKPRTVVQQMFDGVIAGEMIVLGRLSREELVALLTVHEWLDQIIKGTPDPAQVRRAIARSDLLAPMRRLATDDFVGRREELDQLEQFVLELNPSIGPPPPLFIYGPGGVGKSTLLARFILDNVDKAALCTVYVDIDRPTIRPDKPATILLEAITQLRVQLDVPQMIVLESLATEIAHALRRQESGRYLESAVGSPYHRQLEQFAMVFEPLLKGDTLLIAVDTFEEAQFLGADVVWPFLQFLTDFANVLPNLRVIISGRTLPKEYLSQTFPHLPSQLGSEPPDEPTILYTIPRPHRPINLAVLDLESARELLEKSAELAGVEHLRPDEVDDIIGIVSRNPMCIKLAARLLRDEGVDQLRCYRSEFLTKLKAEKIQALLYGRILHHLHTDDVRTIALPGLVVRRITPEVIRQVLAEPCGLTFTDGRDEHFYFEALAREAALVEFDPDDGSLRHRVDVRRAMLEDLTDHVPPYVIDKIDAAAVEFYSVRDDPISRAEEIYHRLRRLDPPETLDDRWIPTAAQRLRTAGEELPAQQRLWLANKLGVTVDDSVRQSADQESWEQQAARSAERYLQAQQPGAALKALGERPTRLPRSRLYLLEAEAYRFLDQPESALKVARAGVESAGTAGATDMALELLLQMVAIEEGRGDLVSAAQLLSEASVVAQSSSNDVLKFRASVTELRLHRQLHPDEPEQGAERRHEVLADVSDELWRAVRTRPVLLRETAAELGADDPQIASAAIETLGVEVATDGQAQTFGYALAALNDAHATDEPLSGTIARGAVLFQDNDFDVDEIRSWTSKVMSSKDVRSLGTRLASVEPGADVLNNFVEYFRAGVDNSFQSPPSLESY
jgi:hypothetical protein